MLKPYSIVTPQFDVVSGGIRVMYGLYGWLLAKGQIVHLNATYNNPDFVGIYPEIIQGNDLGAKTVVRYILQKPGLMGAVHPDGTTTPGQTSFDPSDKIYVFSKIYDTFGVDDNHILFLPVLNLHLFYDYKRVRTKKAVYFGKGLFLPELKGKLNQHPDDTILITREQTTDQQALADLLNECQVLYCYDPATAMTEIARLCGCRVVIYPSWFTKKEFKTYEPGMNGISWNEDTGEKLRVDDFRAHYREMVFAFSKRLDQFIDDTQS